MKKEIIEILGMGNGFLLAMMIGIALLCIAIYLTGMPTSLY